jgi:Flp pilus assembly protein TadG
LLCRLTGGLIARAANARGVTAAHPASGFTRARRAAVAIVFAISAMPIIGLVGLAIDFGIWNQVNAGLSLAANMAAMTAVKVAVNAQTAADPNAVTEGQNAGRNWFFAEIGSTTQTVVGTTPVTLPSSGLSVQVTGGATVTATVTYNGSVKSIFGALFGKTSYPISGTASAQITSDPYVDVEILLDNSGSMEIGATNADIVHLQEITPCNIAKAGYNSPGAVYAGAYLYQNAGGQPYNAYQTSGYDGGIATPAIAPDPPLSYSTFIPTSAISQSGPNCKGILPEQSNGTYPAAGPPCAFACHFDSTFPAGEGNDSYAVARSTIGTSNPITLRFDLVKAATNQVIAAMQADNISSLNNLRVGIFTFDTALTQIYPAPGCTVGLLSCAAGNNWSTAESLVGGPPTVANGPDTGYQPYVGGNGGSTDFHDSMATLLTYMSAAGSGINAAAPRKVLFIVSDGLVDVGADGSSNRTYGGVSESDCTNFKNLGFTIYVLYVPYYPVMSGFYVSTIKPLAEPTSTSTIAEALQACATSPSDYISASAGADIDSALQAFLKSAVEAPARFTD